MLDLGWTEMMVIALVALIVIGPKELPRALKTIAGIVRKMRAMAREFQSGVEDVIREAELDDFKRDIDKATSLDIGGAIENTIDPTGTVNEVLTLEDDTAVKETGGPATTVKESADPAEGIPAAEPVEKVETAEPVEAGEVADRPAAASKTG